MVLKIGSNGKEVKEIQKFLRIISDGKFGKKTHNAVCVWQKENDLVVDGIVGPATWNAMGIASTDNSELIDVGSKGEGVKQIQNILKKNGYDLGEPGVDGKFGPITKKAIKKFQKDRGLNLIDGIVGIETSIELKKG